MKAANNVVVCALYHFVHLPDFKKLQAPLKKLMAENTVRGTLLLAPEGINGTIAGSRDGVDSILKWLDGDERFSELRRKESFTDEMPFNRAKVKLKREIVTMGVEDIDPNDITGTYVKPEDWNELISDPEVTLIDTRNEYEVGIGTFKNAINPHTTSFREFPDYAKTHLNPEKNKKVAMFCTGGIRCEKSTAYLKSLGFDQVYHLQGGILRYLEEIEEEASLWEGECFVFDDRVTVDQQLEKGQYDQCHACRMPISEQDKRSNAYVQGLSCPHCIDKQTDTQRMRFREREKQVQLAKQRGESHIGAGAVAAQEKNRLAKKALKNRTR
ncbi:MAG: rhodanese-related sulfurtransferase [Proteobacteria bacterium]|nr:rhodanese-related sulfurtransferase [Pseudomonadota bacterium]